MTVPFETGERHFDLTTAERKCAAFRSFYPWLGAMPGAENHAHVG